MVIVNLKFDFAPTADEWSLIGDHLALYDALERIPIKFDRFSRATLKIQDVITHHAVKHVFHGERWQKLRGDIDLESVEWR